jgi:hypothetical protein
MAAIWSAIFRGWMVACDDLSWVMLLDTSCFLVSQRVDEFGYYLSPM